MKTFRKAIGGRELQRYLLDNKRLSPRQMVIAKCYDCMCQYVEGRVDCGVNECPCYGLMPYNGLEKFKSRSITQKHLGKLKHSRKKDSNA